MAHCVKVFALKNCQAEFSSQYLHRGKRRASTPQNCPVSSRYVAWHAKVILMYKGLTVENKRGKTNFPEEVTSSSSCNIIF